MQSAIIMQSAMVLRAFVMKKLCLFMVPRRGMAHIAMAICDPGDVVLVPNPGYPVLQQALSFVVQKVETYDLGILRTIS